MVLTHFCLSSTASSYLPWGLFIKTLKAEISALESAGRLPASAYEGATMYTTLSPCDMCTGACILYKIKRVVLGENKTFLGGEDYLRSRGVEVVNVKSDECEALMIDFIKKKPGDWYVPSSSCFCAMVPVREGRRCVEIEERKLGLTLTCDLQV